MLSVQLPNQKLLTLAMNTISPVSNCLIELFCSVCVDFLFDSLCERVLCTA